MLPKTTFQQKLNFKAYYKKALTKIKQISDFSEHYKEVEEIVKQESYLIDSGKININLLANEIDSLLLHWFLNGILSHGLIPNLFNMSVITPILKKDKIENDPFSYRPISVSSALATIYEIIIKKKITYPSESTKI
jgi:hypothetical protein